MHEFAEVERSIHMKKGKHQIVKKITAKASVFAAAFTLSACLTGCQTGNGETSDLQTGAPAGTAQEQQTGAAVESDAMSMGRYVEKQAELGEGMEGNSYMTRDGENVKMFAYGSTLFTSEDNGDTWSATELEWYTKLQEEKYIMETAFTNDGTYAIQYSPLSKREDTLKEGMEADMEADTESSGDDDYTIEPHLMIVSPDGTQKEVPVQFSSDEMYARQLHYTQDGRLFMITFGKGVYEVDVETGALNRLCTIENNAVTMDTQGKYLMVVTYDGVLIYDMESERFVEDEVLIDFVKETYNEPADYGNCYNMYAFFGEENTVYIAGSAGLHRHVIGGAAVEQVIDPGLSSFGNPSRDIVHAMALANEEFLAQFSDGSVIKFYYDATVPTVPSDKLVVYSLADNDTVRQAIAAYQTANPGVFVEYEAALSGDGVTREDALKNLSTRLLNEEGPDVLILDDMPLDTYVEKGILLDMSELITEVKNGDGLYENLFEPFTADGRIYVVPTEFELPLVMGDNQYVEQSRSYKGYAQVIETLRAENPEGMIIEDCNEQGITMRFTPVCAPAWKNEDGSINENNIREFLEQTKKICDAQMKGLSQKQVSDYSEMSIFKGGNDDGVHGQIDFAFYWKMINSGSFVQSGVKMTSGNVYSMSSLTEALSMPKNEGLEHLSIGQFDGQSEGVYMPETLTGINAQSKNIETAKSFVKLMLSQEVQTNTFRGLPVNKAAFETLLAEHDDTREEGDGIYMMYGGSDQEGNSWFWNAWWFDEEQKQLVRGWVAQAKTPHITDSVLEDAVQNACVEYLKGRLSLDDAVSQIRSSTAIYMSE